MQDHGLTPLFLPTDASWLNPIEKLWRWLKLDSLHLPTLASDLETLGSQVRGFLDGFSSASDPLLRYVGLLLD
jgi:transposase